MREVTYRKGIVIGVIMLFIGALSAILFEIIIGGWLLLSPII